MSQVIHMQNHEQSVEFFWINPIQSHGETLFLLLQLHFIFLPKHNAANKHQCLDEKRIVYLGNLTKCDH